MFDNAIKPMEHAKKMAEEHFPDEIMHCKNSYRTGYILAIRDAHADPTPFGLALHSTYQTEKINKEFIAKLLESKEYEVSVLKEALEKINKEIDAFWNSGVSKIVMPEKYKLAITKAQKDCAEALNNYNKE